MKSDSFDPSETESSTSERTSVEGERRTEEEEEVEQEGNKRRELEEERVLPPPKEQVGQFSTATIKPKVGSRDGQKTENGHRRVKAVHILCPPFNGSHQKMFFLDLVLNKGGGQES